MSVDAGAFRETMAHWASGVTVVTAMDDGQRVGITASSLASVSLNPPRVLVCVSKKLYTHGAIESGGTFAVNILEKSQLEWGMRFAGLMPEVQDRFEDIVTQTAVTGSPILPGVLGWLDCTVAHAYDGGDHTIFVGNVEACGASEAGSPLLYFNRHWRELHEPALVLERRGE